MYRLLLVGAVGLLVPGFGGADDAKDKKNREAGLKVEGKLTSDDPADKFLKTPHKVHEYKMKAGKIYVIDLSSKDFDSFLRLENSAGKNLAANDDATPDTLDARLVFKAPKDDTYRIIVTMLKPKEGAYLLTARQGTAEDLAKADPFYRLIGKSAPEVKGEFSLNGETKKLSDLKGKVVLLDFWAVWCGPCIQTFPHLRDWTKEYQKDGLEILGVTTYYEVLSFDKEKGKLKKVDALKSAEEHDMIKDFAAYHKLTHRLMTVSKDNWMKVSKDYLIQGIPHAVVIDRKGQVRMVRVGSGQENADALHAEIKKLLAEK